jgi:hypothetical protein
MALLGFLILVGVTLTIIAIVFRGGDSVRIDLEWFTINTNAWVVFAAGAVTVLLLVLGLWLFVSGMRRRRRKRAELRALRQRADANEAAARQNASTGAVPSERGNGPDEHFESTPREN